MSDIPDDGLTVADSGEFVAPFSERAWRLETVRLHVARDERDVVVTGELTASVPLTCSRCVEEFRVTVRPTVEVRYVPRPPVRHDGELASDDLDLDFYENGEVDLDTLVETETTLALPMKPLCRPECRGLCPVCGSNRNLVQCTCPASAPDPRLAILKRLSSGRTD